MIGAAVAAGKLGFTRIVAGERFFDVDEHTDAERVDHGKVVDDDGNEGFAHGPGASGLGAVDGVLEESIVWLGFWFLQRTHDQD